MKICSFSVVPGNGQALLGMPDIEMLGILTINYNTIDTKEVDGSENCKRTQTTAKSQQVNSTA